MKSKRIADRAFSYLLSALAVAAVLAPLVAVAIPPLTDFSAHILVSHILLNFDNPELAYRRFFSLQPVPSPTTLAYLLLAPLQAVAGPIGGGKLYLLLFVLLTAWSATRLRRAVGATDGLWLVPTMLLVCCSWYVYMGFLPFLFSLPLFALLIAAYYCRKHSRLRHAALTALLLQLLAFHVVGGALGIAAVCWLALSRLLRSKISRKQALWESATTLPTLCWLLLYLAGSVEVTLAPKSMTAMAKLKAFFGYSAASLDDSSLYLWLAALGLAALVAAVHVRRKTARTELIGLALILVLGGLALPVSFGSLWPAGPRVLPFVLIVLIASYGPLKREKKLLGAATCLALLTIGAGNYRQAKNINLLYAEFLSGASHVPLGSRSIVIFADSDYGQQKSAPLWTIDSLYTVARGGANPHVFAAPYVKTAATPLRYRKNESVQPRLAERKAPETYLGISAEFDSVITWDADERLVQVLQNEMSLQHESGRLKVFIAQRQTERAPAELAYGM